MVTINKCRYEDKTCEVTYHECVPVTKTEDYQVTVNKMVSEQVEQSYNVCVPYTVEEEYQVQVCTKVPQTVTVPVYANSSCSNGCGLGLGGRLRGLFSRGCDSGCGCN